VKSESTLISFSSPGSDLSDLLDVVAEYKENFPSAIERIDAVPSETSFLAAEKQFGSVVNFVNLKASSARDFSVSVEPKTRKSDSTIVITVPQKRVPEIVEGFRAGGERSSGILYVIAHELGHVVYRDHTRLASDAKTGGTDANSKLTFRLDWRSSHHGSRFDSAALRHAF
jgi:hypothetical protein